MPDWDSRRSQCWSKFELYKLPMSFIKYIIKLSTKVNVARIREYIIILCNKQFISQLALSSNQKYKPGEQFFCGMLLACEGCKEHLFGTSRY